jgi:hypothetical protein
MNGGRRTFMKWTVPVVTAIVLPVSSFAANSSGASIGKDHDEKKDGDRLKKKFKHLFQHDKV